MNNTPNPTVNTIVLVHAGFVDGSGWEEICGILKKDHYNLEVQQVLTSYNNLKGNADTAKMKRTKSSFG